MSSVTRYEELRRSLEQRKYRWVVTGAAGFVGSALVETLLSLGQSVVGLDNLATGHKENLAPFGDALEFVEGDICDPATCARVCEGADFVLHQAALGSVPRSLANPLRSHQANVDGFINMILAARDAKVRRFVYASSSSVYGDAPGLPKVEAQIGRPLSPYAATKRVDEIYAGVVQDAYGLQAIGLRYFNVFGRRQDPQGAYAAVIPRWILQLLRGEPCTVFGDGTYSRDFCYVDNAVQANLLAAFAEASATNRAYNVACSEETDLKTLFETIRELLGRHDPAILESELCYGENRPGDVPHSLASLNLISEHLGYQPTHAIQEGMEKTVEWYVTAAAQNPRSDPDPDGRQPASSA
jgi:UDP-N-acetylglucosamine/UDP-N-acetylgalactosamine 4-epimerase